MKKWLVLLLGLSIMGCVPRTLVTPGFDCPEIKRVTVLPFSYDKTNLFPARLDSFALTNEFIRELINLGRFEIVERARLDRVLEEQLLNVSGVVDDRVLIKIGRILGADAVFVGFVYHDRRWFKWYSVVSVRLVDLRTGRVVWAGRSYNVKKLVKALE